MTSRTVPVAAQWALEGKQPDGEDYRILACSTGDLTRRHFAEALGRFQLGELNTLPQVSVSYARLAMQPGSSYVSLAIHWYATEDQRHAGGVSQRDNQGRPTAYTSYFCMPYKHLADAAIGYLAMHEALHPVTLSVADGPPIQVPVALPKSRTPAAGDLAVRVAPLLLTGRPVCVLGAEGTSMLERLEFIDTVMELLPYGLRARMTAATWTRASNRNHRFRLFFSAAPRAGEPDYEVIWGDSPELVSVPDREAGEYFDWLQDNIGQLARLTDLTGEMGFGPKHTLQALESVLGVRHRLQFRPRPAGGPGQPPPGDIGEETLVCCAEHAGLANLTRMRSDVTFLKKFAEGEIGEERRARYRDLIGRLGLLRPGFLVDGRYEERLYGALLRMAFGTPLSYDAYCWAEDCAGAAPGDAPHRELLVAIAKAGMAEPAVSAIVYGHLRRTDARRVSKWLVSGHFDAAAVIGLLAGDWTCPEHARIVCDLTLEYLKRAPGLYQPQQVRRALSEHGFLARALQLRHPGEDQYQVHVLYRFLAAAYPQAAATPGQDLSRAAIVQVLNGGGAPPTPALLSAVLMLLHKPGSWQLAWDAYINGSLTLASFDEPTLARLRARLPHIEAAAVSGPTTSWR
ncbi:MAG TPA: hypothetical protein VMC83_06755 [Streptosporangiaceae bacterium]|nr:hypothetical protein [Streptosporangiaceae bacterium]